MMRVAILVCVFAAGCDLTSEDCQEDVGIGEVFIDPADVATTTPTCVGGTQRFTASTNVCAGHVQITNLLAVTEDPSIATVHVVDDAFDVTGVKAGSASVHISGKQAGGAPSFSVAAIDHVALSGQTGHATFSTATRFAEIQLVVVGDGPFDQTPCVDRSVTVSGGLPLGDRWNHLLIQNAAPGDYAETIHAGGVDWPMTVTVTP